MSALIGYAFWLTGEYVVITLALSAAIITRVHYLEGDMGNPREFVREIGATVCGGAYRWPSILWNYFVVPASDDMMKKQP